MARSLASTIIVLVFSTLCRVHFASASEVLFTSPLPIEVFAVSPDGQLVAYCGNSLDFEVYNRTTKERITFEAAHTNVIWSLAFSPTANLVVSGSNNGEIKVWSVVDRRLLASAKPSNAVLNASFLNEHTIGFRSIGKSVRVLEFDKASKRLFEKTRIQVRRTGLSAFFPDGSKYVIASSILYCEPDSKPGDVRFYHTSTGMPAGQVHLGHTEFSSICFIDDHRFVIGDQAGWIFMVDPTNKSVRKTKVDGDIISSIAFAPGPNKIIAASYGGKMFQIEPTSLQSSMIGKHGIPMNYIYWLKKEQRVISAGYDKAFRSFELLAPK